MLLDIKNILFLNESNMKSAFRHVLWVSISNRLFQILRVFYQFTTIDVHVFGLYQVRVLTIVLDAQTKQKHKTMKLVHFVEQGMHDAANGFKKQAVKK